MQQQREVTRSKRECMQQKQREVTRSKRECMQQKQRAQPFEAEGYTERSF